MFKYYNANPLKRHVSDCSVRAISLATERTWDEAYKILSEHARIRGITFTEIDFINEFLSERYKCISKSDICTLRDFLSLELPGRYLVTMSGHITCVIDGVCYDTFDPSDKEVWCIYRIK